MLRLTLPTSTPADVLTLCALGVADRELSERLDEIMPALVEAAVSYHQHATAATLHLIPRVLSVGDVTKDELVTLYTRQMSASAGTARSVYNAIRNSAKNDKCPLCGIGTVKVLDHHLPSSKYPNLAVCPLNLVPACVFCNNSKRARFPRQIGDQTLHPYYDDFTQDQWIHARLEKDGSPTLIFFVDLPPHETQVNLERVRRHFEVVSLGHSFTSNANHELITLRGHLNWVNKTGGSEAVQNYLEGEVRRYSERLNSWQYVSYKTLASDVWFVSGGYRQIPG